MALGNWFWNPDIWLPPNVTWADLVPNEKIQYADHRDLYYGLVWGILLIGVRRCIEKYVPAYLYSLQNKWLAFFYGDDVQKDRATSPTAGVIGIWYKSHVSAQVFKLLPVVRDIISVFFVPISLL